MTIEQLRLAARAKPFKPFTVCLTDGRRLDVTHPEILSMAPEAARTFIIWGPGENYRVVDLLLVTTLDFLGTQEATGAGGNGSGQRSS